MSNEWVLSEKSVRWGEKTEDCDQPKAPSLGLLKPWRPEGCAGNYVARLIVYFLPSLGPIKGVLMKTLCKDQPQKVLMMVYTLRFV